MKRFLYTLAVGGLGGTVFILFVAPLIYRANFLNSARVINALLSSRTEVRKIEREVVTSSEDDQIQEAIRVTQDSVVAIKSYQGGNLMRFGSGVVVTQDGLILTINQVVPPEATDYQVFSGDKILKGIIVERSARNNLALLKITDDSLRPANFDDKVLDPGTAVLILGKTALLQQIQTFVNRLWVSTFDSRSKRLVLDGRYENYLSGAGLIGKDGSFKGIVYIDGTGILALPSNLVEDFVNNYLK